MLIVADLASLKDHSFRWSNDIWHRQEHIEHMHQGTVRRACVRAAIRPSVCPGSLPVPNRVIQYARPCLVVVRLG